MVNENCETEGEGEQFLPSTSSISHDSVETNLQSETLPITFLIKFIKPFDGNRDELSSFIADCNKAFALANNSQKFVLLDYIQTQISGKAKAACVNRQFKTWDELKSFLKTMYQDRKHYAQLLCELTNLKQNSNENVSQFVCRVEACLKRTINSTQQQNSDSTSLKGKLEMLDEIALNRFIYFSLPHISNVLRIRELKTLNEAISVAVAEEQVQNMYFTNKFNTKYCKNCKTSTHNTIDCRNKQKNVHIVQNEHEKTNPKAYLNKVCKYCKLKGHLIDECRKRQYANKFKNASQTNTKNPNQLPVEVAALGSSERK